MKKRIGYVHVDPSTLDLGNFILAFSVLAQRVRIIEEKIYGTYIEYIGESIFFAEVDETDKLYDGQWQGLSGATHKNK